jgi:hypothetical protein
MRRSALRDEALDERPVRASPMGELDARPRGSRTERSAWSLPFLASAAAA